MRRRKANDLFTRIFKMASPRWWKFIKREKKLLVSLSLYPFAAGLIIGSGVKDYFNELVHARTDR